MSSCFLTICWSSQFILVAFDLHYYFLYISFQYQLPSSFLWIVFDAISIIDSQSLCLSVPFGGL